MYDLIIIGGGPAGLTASIYAARKKINFLLLTEEIGGEPNKTSTIENYPGFELIEGPKLTERWKKHLESLNPEIKHDSVTKIEEKNSNFLVQTKLGKYQAKKILLALGSTPRLLNIPGEREFKGSGVSFCSTCDAPLFAKKDVAVIGGGNSALETVIDLEKYAKKIYLINNTDSFICDRIFLDRIKKCKQIEILTNTEVLEIEGSSLVEKIIISQQNKKREINIQGVFVNIGYLPNTKVVKNIVKTDKLGQIIIDDKNKTSNRNIFAAGDCTNTPYKQIIIAAGEGAKALLTAIEDM